MASDKKQVVIQFIKFGLVGISNTVISYLTYVVFVFLGAHYVVANVFSFIISVINSFFWNYKFVFISSEDENRIWWKVLARTFVAYGFTGLILNNILLILMLSTFNIAQYMDGVVSFIGNHGYYITNIKLATYIAPLFVLIVTIPLNFVINKLWAFKQDTATE